MLFIERHMVRVEGVGGRKEKHARGCASSSARRDRSVAFQASGPSVCKHAPILSRVSTKPISTRRLNEFPSKRTRSKSLASGSSRARKSEENHTFIVCFGVLKNGHAC